MCPRDTQLLSKVDLLDPERFERALSRGAYDFKSIVEHEDFVCNISPDPREINVVVGCSGRRSLLETTVHYLARAATTSVREARTKLFVVTESLTGDQVLASRLAAATSEICRVLSDHDGGAGLTLALGVDRHPSLELRFEDHSAIACRSFELSVFDVVSSRVPHDGVYGLNLSKSLPGAPPSEESIDKAQRVVREKGRDQLLTEIQAKNVELERHQANLEQTVHERTQQLEEAMDAAEGANRAKSDFLANMSHELRTPMNAIIGYAEMLMEDAEDDGDDESLDDLKKIRTAGKHLLSLINDVLDISKIEAGKMELYLETFELDSLTDEIVATVESLVENNGNTLVVERAESGLGTMHADLTKIRQALFNLISNAAKFTSEGTITLSIARADVDAREHVVFRVADTGIGIPEAALETLFQEFTQVDASTTREYGGTGLGLAITQRFCEMMRGAIDVESEVGRGTTFTMRVPAKVEDLPDDAGNDEPEEEEHGEDPAR